MPNLLLHICCGPCATTVVEQLRGEYSITGFFYNPNIYPEAEYLKRLEATRTVAHEMNFPLIEGEYNSDTYYHAVKGFEHEPEGGARCNICYRVRLSETARLAHDRHFDAIATTLSVGPMKNAAIINAIGDQEADSLGLKFITGDWKSGEGYRRSVALSKEMGLYRQRYCGCKYAMRPERRA